MDVVGEFMKPVFLHQGCLKKSTVLGYAEQFANNIGMCVIFPDWGSVQQSSSCWTVKLYFEVFR
jgi:hypothetical protein